MTEAQPAPEPRWPRQDLESELAAFELAYRERGLREHTLDAYMRVAGSFADFLVTGQVAGGVARPVRQRPPVDASLGKQVLEDLAVRASPETIAAALATYQVATRSDEALRALGQVTGGRADLGLPMHRMAVIAWCRVWRCRHLRVADDDQLSAALLVWWEAFGNRIARSRADLISVSARHLTLVEKGYDDLASASTAHRIVRGVPADVVLGDSAAGRILAAISPALFIPWDVPVRSVFGWRHGSGARYVEFLTATGDALRTLAERLSIPVPMLPASFGRPDVASAKLLEEYLWVTVTREIGGRTLQAVEARG